MNSTTKLFLTALTLAALSVGAWAQSTAAPQPAPAVTAADVQALKDALAAQQKQIERLTQQLERQETLQQAQTAGGSGAAAQVQPVSLQQPVELKDAVLRQQDTTSPGLSVQETQAGPDQNPMHGPISIHFKGITITPGGFAEAAFVRRSRALAADLTTPFNSLTLPGASQNSLSE